MKTFYKAFNESNDSYDGICLDLYQKSKIRITYSSIVTSEFTFPEAIFYSNQTLFISDTNCTNESNFYQLELVNHVAYIEGYKMQSHYHSDTYFLRSWKVSASLDGINWDLLHSEENVDVFANGSYITHPINEKGPYRYFKITQTGPAAGGKEVDKCRLRIQRLDFFGTAIYIPPKTDSANPQMISMIFRGVFFISLAISVK